MLVRYAVTASSQCAVYRKVNHPEQNRHNHARQKDTCALKRPQQTAFPKRKHALAQTKPQHRAQQGILDCKNQPCHQAAERQPCKAHRLAAPAVFRISNRHRRHQQRQAELLRAVPLAKRRADQHDCAPYRRAAEGPRSARSQAEKPIRRKERRRQGKRFHQIDAQKAGI